MTSTNFQFKLCIWSRILFLEFNPWTSQKEKNKLIIILPIVLLVLTTIGVVTYLYYAKNLDTRSKASSAPVDLYVTIGVKSGKIDPIWETANVHLLGTYFNPKISSYATQGWLTTLFPYYKYGRTTATFGGVDPITYKLRTGVSYAEIYNEEGLYNFTQHNQDLQALLKSGLIPEIGIKAVSPYADYDLDKNSTTYYEFKASLKAPYSAASYVTYVNKIIADYKTTFPNQYNTFKYNFWHEPEETYLPFDCYINGVKCTTEQIYTYRTNERFESFYQLYKAVLSDANLKANGVISAPVFLKPGNEYSWLKRFLERAHNDKLVLPYVGVNLYVETANDSLFTNDLTAINDLKQRYGYSNIPTWINETGSLWNPAFPTENVRNLSSSQPNNFSASMNAFMYKNFINKGVSRYNTWLVDQYFSYNYDTGNYQDYRKWIKTPTANFYEMMNKMKNSDYYKTNIAIATSIESDRRVNFVVGKNTATNTIYVMGYNYISAVAVEGNSKSTDSKANRTITTSLNLQPLLNSSKKYSIGLYMIDKDHSNFYETFRKEVKKSDGKNYPQYPSRSDFFDTTNANATPKLVLTDAQIARYQTMDDLVRLYFATPQLYSSLANYTVTMPDHSVFLLEIKQL